MISNDLIITFARVIECNKHPTTHTSRKDSQNKSPAKTLWPLQIAQIFYRYQTIEKWKKRKSEKQKATRNGRQEANMKRELYWWPPGGRAAHNGGSHVAHADWGVKTSDSSWNPIFLHNFLFLIA